VNWEVDRVQKKRAPGRMTLLANSINALFAKVNRVFLNLAHFSSHYRFPELNELLHHFGLKIDNAFILVAIELKV
jgi:hypothetical protein